MGQKITLQNTGTKVGYFSYQDLRSLEVFPQVSIQAGQSLNIWCVTNSLKIYNLPNANVVVTSSETYPPVAPTPTAINRHSALVVSSVEGFNGWQYATFDYDTATLNGPNTSVLTRNPLYEYDTYTLTNNGYMVVYGDDCDLGCIINTQFYDYQGTSIGSYTAETNNWNYYGLDDSFLAFIDYDNGVLTYTDGVTVKTLEWDNNNYELYIDTSYDNSIIGRFLVWSGSGNYASYSLVGMDGVYPIMNYDERYYNVSLPKYRSADFIPVIVNTDNDDTYSFFNIYDKTGRILQEVNLLEDNLYNNYYVNYFGYNKFNVIFRNNGDSGIPYLIYTYDGNTNTLISTTHERGSNYFNYNTYYRSDDRYAKGMFDETLIITFYDDNGSWDGDLYSVSYYDILPYFGGDTSYRSPYQFIYDGYRQVAPYNENISSSFQIPVDNDDSYLSILTLTPTGDSINQVCLLNSLDGYNFNTFNAYDADYYMLATSVYSSYILYAFDLNGNQLDARPLADYYNDNTYFNTFYIEDTTNGWYFNNVTNDFKVIGKYNDIYYPNYGTGMFTGTKNGHPILLNNGYDVRVLLNGSISDTFTLPTSNNYFNIRMGYDRFMYTYQNGQNYFVCNVYDFSFNIINTITTKQTSGANTYLLDERVLLVTYDGSTRYFNFLSQYGNYTLEFSVDVSRYVSFNDGNW